MPRSEDRAPSAAGDRLDGLCATICNSFRNALPRYLVAMPVLLVLGLTQPYGSRDFAAQFLNLLPILWLMLAGGHLILFLALKDRKPRARSRPAPFKYEAPGKVAVVEVSADQMMAILQGVLNKNAQTSLDHLKPTYVVPPGAPAGTDATTLVMDKFATVVIFGRGDLAMPAAIDTDASILVEMVCSLPQVDSTLAMSLYHRSKLQPTLCRFVVENSAAASWTHPDNPPPAAMATTTSKRRRQKR